MTALRDVPVQDPIGAGLQSAADRALQLAGVQPAEARTLGGTVLRAARRAGAWCVVSTGERAIGVADMNLGDIDGAVAHLRAAETAGRRADCRRHVGEARMSLASALVMRGRPGAAVRAIEAAIGDLQGGAAARARVQRAAILQELGRYDEALEELRRTLPLLRRSGDAEWAVRALSNRSLIHAARRALSAAESDLLAARRLCDGHRLDLPAAFAEQNLGCVKALRGDVPAALRCFDSAQERYERLGVVEPSLLVDRAEVLLSVRLLGEAREAAESAVAGYRQQRREVHVPEAQLLLSTVALLQGDTTAARQSAEAAARSFRRLGRTGSLALARYARLQAVVGASPVAGSPARAAAAAAELEAAGWPVPALDARVMACRMALERGIPATARRHLSEASRARRAGPADARARAWLAEALLRRADARRPAALSALRAGLRIVEDHQATLGATELRAHVSVQRGAIARSGVRMSLEDRDPRKVLWWAERGRASALLGRPARPPDDPELARALADLRTTMAEIADMREDGGSETALVARQVALERRIRDRCRTLDGAGRAERGRESVAELVGGVGEVALVEFVELAGELHAVTVAGGRARLHALGGLDDVRRALLHVPLALHRLATPRAASGSRTAAAAAVLERAAAVFDDHLLRPLRSEVGDRPLVLVPSVTLQSLPWSILPSCRGRPVAVAPSATLWRRASTGPRPGPDAPVVVVAGPGLPGAVAEAAAVARVHPGAELVSGTAATVATVARCLDGAGLVHLAAHGSVRSDNPLFSALTLADGPYTVYELERLARMPHQVVLAACDAGRSQVVAGEEVLGFGAALIGGGTATLVAPVVPVPDAETVPLMLAWHERRRAGSTPAEALAGAQAQFGRADPAAWAAAAAFVCLGAG